MNGGSVCVDCVHRGVCYGAKITNVAACSDYEKESAEKGKEDKAAGDGVIG